MFRVMSDIINLPPGPTLLELQDRWLTMGALATIYGELGSPRPTREAVTTLFQNFMDEYNIGEPAGSNIYAAYSAFTKFLNTHGTKRTSKATRVKIANCVKEVGNWSKLATYQRFDSATFDPVQFKKDIKVHSPKLNALLENISKLDAADLAAHGQLFKHFIYSDIKSPYGAKLIASALAAAGFGHAYELSGGSFRMKAATAATQGRRFATMTSVSFFGKPIGIQFRRSLLREYNARPDNVHGDNIRIIILDSGFREGVDLFDVKYAHLFEPIITAADQKQAIGRVTRFCGQSGLAFERSAGWPVHVFRYETLLTLDVRAYMIQSAPQFFDKTTASVFDVFLKFSNIDPIKVRFANELEPVVVDAAVDKPLTRAIHAPATASGSKPAFGDLPRKFHQYTWPPMKIENGCASMPSSLEFSPTQNFVRNYLTVDSDLHGLLAFHSVGTGKTCMAIATATTTFEPAGWTIIYVTKHTLKADVWKNMFDQSCSTILQERIRAGLLMPKDNAARMRLISKSWKAIQPLSYRQFSNMLSGKGALAQDLEKLNGKQDPLSKCLVIIDEAHKLYAADVAGSEKANIEIIKTALMNSYTVSGKDAAKVLLMTGTPYTDDPMDMIKLLNLLRKPGDQLPEEFDTFAQAYLSPATGAFTQAGRAKFARDIAGSVSYLNRSNDIRTFAYPIIKDVRVPMSTYEYQLELDEFLIESKFKSLAEEQLADKVADWKKVMKGLKDTAVYKGLAMDLKACKKTEAERCKTAAAAATAAAKARMKEQEDECVRAGQKRKDCKPQFKPQLDADLAIVKAEKKRCTAAAEELCNRQKDEMGDHLKRRKAEIKQAIDQLKTDVAIRKHAVAELSKGLTVSYKEDRSQQTALDECLSDAGVISAFKNMRKSMLAPDVGLGSHNSSVSDVNDSSVYLVSGHGNETGVAFEDRPVLPEGVTLVVFSTCFRPNFVNHICDFMDTFVGNLSENVLSDPIKHKELIERTLGVPIRVYKPGNKYPVLANTLFLNFEAHKTQILKSGVFRIPDIPQIQAAYNMNDDRIVDIYKCMKYSRVIPSPAHYSKSVHKDIYDGNVYNPAAAKQLSYADMKERLFPMSDIMRKVGPGVYYYLGCRSSDKKKDPTPEQLAAILRQSDQQQAADQAAENI